MHNVGYCALPDAARDGIKRGVCKCPVVRFHVEIADKESVQLGVPR